MTATMISTYNVMSTLVTIATMMERVTGVILYHWVKGMGHFVPSQRKL